MAKLCFKTNQFNIVLTCDEGVKNILTTQKNLGCLEMVEMLHASLLDIWVGAPVIALNN